MDENKLSVCLTDEEFATFTKTCEERDFRPCDVLYVFTEAVRRGVIDIGDMICETVAPVEYKIRHIKR